MAELTEPNLEVRIGSIYALERIARDSDRDHIQIMEIVCAYVRKNSPVQTLEPREGFVDGVDAASYRHRNVPL
jgi:hypothetical protein